MGAQRHLAHHAKGPAAPALQRPKEIGICTCIGDPDLAVCRHYLSFEQAAGGSSIVLRVTSKASALNQAAEAHREASSPLNVSPSLGGDRVVRLYPYRAGSDRHRGLRLHRMLASLRHERVMHLDIVHITCPDQERIGRV